MDIAYGEKQAMRGLIRVSGSPLTLPAHRPGSVGGVSVVPGSAKVQTKVKKYNTHIFVRYPEAYFRTSPISAEGEALGVVFADGQVTFRGGADDRMDGWTIGFIQVECIETNWAHYRGKFNKDGSLFVQRGAPAGWQVCQDTHNIGDIWYGSISDVEQARPIGSSFPVTVRQDFIDGPNDHYPLVKTNPLTRRDNFLHEVKLEFDFCTAFSAQDPTGVFHHLLHFYWGVHWQARFAPTDFSNARSLWKVIMDPQPRANGLYISEVFSGMPQQNHFRDVLATPTTNATCNMLAERPGIHHAKPDWANFGVWK